MNILKKIKNYFHKKKIKKEYKKTLNVFFKTIHRECPYLITTMVCKTQYCTKNKENLLNLCNPYYCSYIASKLIEFGKYFKKEHGEF